MFGWLRRRSDRVNPSGYRVTGMGFLKIPGRDRRLAEAEARAKRMLELLDHEIDSSKRTNS